MERNIERPMLDCLKMLAPGTPLRAGLDNILRANTGALIVVSDTEEVMGVVDGGFEVEIDYSPSVIYELAKMDGAIILAENLLKIRYANAHLVPNPGISSSETGIRHRTAERVAKQTGKLVISISQRRDIISLYQGSMKYVMRQIGIILTKANQAVQTLEKYRSVLDQALINLSALEFEDNVTMYDITTVLQKTEMVLRIGEEIENHIIELGTEGRLVSMQLDELIARVNEHAYCVLRDYGSFDSVSEVRNAQKQLRNCTDDELLDHLYLSKLLRYGGTSSALDLSISPCGYRLINQIPRIPTNVVENVVQEFDSLQKIMGASIEALDDVEGIGEVRARAIKDGLRRLQEQAFIDRHY